MKKIYFVLSLLILSFCGFSQTTVFTDNFNTSTGATYTAAAGAIGTVSTGVMGALGAVAGNAAALAGIFSFCPTLMLVVLRLLAALIAFGVVPKCRAMRVRVSPDFTV